jgi:hypothetical protein
MLNSPVRALFLTLLLTISFGIESALARIQMPENAGTFNRQLVDSLNRIQGIHLEVANGYLTTRARLPQISPAWNPLSLTIPVSFNSSSRSSGAARNLLFGAIDSPNVYKVKVTGSVPLGKAGREFRLMELNVTDISEIVYRGIPRGVFDSGMIFLHELIHLYLGLSDPSPEQAKQNPYVKGQTVEYMNQIERELGLPERGHYYPVEVSRNSRPRYSIFFGSNGGRVDLPDSLIRYSGN